MTASSECPTLAPILIVEDNDEDYYTTARTLTQAGALRQIHRCRDGEEALDYLYRRDLFADPGTAATPCLIVLDLNLPGTDGREVLREIKGHAHLCRIPVVILTTSADPRDVAHCYHEGANSYIQKAVNLQEFRRTMTNLIQYWFGSVLLPPQDPDEVAPGSPL